MQVRFLIVAVTIVGIVVLLGYMLPFMGGGKSQFGRISAKLGLAKPADAQALPQIVLSPSASSSVTPSATVQTSPTPEPPPATWTPEPRATLPPVFTPTATPRPTTTPNPSLTAQAVSATRAGGAPAAVVAPPIVQRREPPPPRATFTPTATPRPTFTPTPAYDYIVKSFKAIPEPGYPSTAQIRVRLIDKNGQLVKGTHFEIRSDAIPDTWTAIEPHTGPADGTAVFIVTKGNFVVRVVGGRSEYAGWLTTGNPDNGKMSSFDVTFETTR